MAVSVLEQRAGVLVIGGGAAGLMAAIAAARTGASVVLAEKGVRVGQKIRATGNGRCNLSNLAIAGKGAGGRYNDPAFAAPVIRRYGCDEVRALFGGLGLLTEPDAKGWVFPGTRLAASVVDVLSNELGRLGVAVHTGCGIEGLSFTEGGALAFAGAEGGTCRAGGGVAAPLAATGAESGAAAPLAAEGLAAEGEALRFVARTVVVACGVGPLLHALEPHVLREPVAVLGPLATERPPLKGLDGVRARAALTLAREGRELFREEGEVLFRPFGVSGIVSFDLSRFAEEGDVVQLDFFPSYDGRELASLLAARHLQNPSDSLGRLLDGMLHPRLAQAVARAAAARPDTPPDRALLEKVARVMKAYRLRVTAGPSLSQAQVTRGGLATEGFDASTLRSLHRPCLFAAGECLDVDGPCGGFNLHWAWASGYTAGTSAGSAAT
ncbi:MAG: NAD(P)/FAD-dependent oxidoreductase [Coriobacteriales bacterium]|jgi:predicted flavoprotein YhiN|nr:NAD(P)/FAD-dependent oxidoreductase [Coriobacteriales bacterium]